jgi:predicted transcriptional regulator
MEQPLLSAEQVQAALAPLTLKQMDRLAELSGVPATTIYKIKRGETANPGIETVRKFMPFVEEASRAPAPQEAA